MRIIYEFDDACKNIVYVAMPSIREALADALCKRLECDHKTAAFRLGIRQEHWSQWRHGVRPLHEHQVQKIAALLDVDEWLVNK